MMKTSLITFFILLFVALLVLLVCLLLGILDPKIEQWNNRLKKILKRAKKNQNNWTEMQLLKLDVKELLDKMITAYEKGYLTKQQDMKEAIVLLKSVLHATDAPSMIKALTRAKDLLQVLVYMNKRQAYREYQATRVSNVRHKRPVRRRSLAGLSDASPENSTNQSKDRKLSNYHDNHWESSFDWRDRNNDGYDDRNDGFWQEAE